jgi:hypothetical protein
MYLIEINVLQFPFHVFGPIRSPRPNRLLRLPVLARNITARRNDVRFSNRPVEVKRFQTHHDCDVDVTCGPISTPKADNPLARLVRPLLYCRELFGSSRQKFSSDRGDKPPLGAQPYSGQRYARSPWHGCRVIGHIMSGFRSRPLSSRSSVWLLRCMLIAAVIACFR